MSKDYTNNSTTYTRMVLKHPAIHYWIPAGLGGAPLKRAQKAQYQNSCSFMFAEYTPQNF